MSRFGEPQAIVDALAVRDTTEHTPDTDSEIEIFGLYKWRGVSLKVVNDLDQAVTVRLYGNFAWNTTDAVLYPGPLTVSANSVAMMTLHVAKPTHPWTPALYPTVQANTAPTTGTVTVTAVGFDGMRDI